MGRRTRQTRRHPGQARDAERDGRAAAGPPPDLAEPDQVEALASVGRRWGRNSSFWLTMSQAAKAQGLGCQRVYRLELPTRRAGNSDLLARWLDLAHLTLDRRCGGDN
jgi:hypothetical protein